jgi:serine/threonine protein kinase
MRYKQGKQKILISFLQYGVFADIYSLSIILFELFSGIDPFPGNIGQIVQAKLQDEKPEFPIQFPAGLKNIISCGWSRKPRERPKIENLKSVLSFMLKQEEERSWKGYNKANTDNNISSPKY